MQMLPKPSSSSPKHAALTCQPNQHVQTYPDTHCVLAVHPHTCQILAFVGECHSTYPPTHTASHQHQQPNHPTTPISISSTSPALHHRHTTHCPHMPHRCIVSRWSHVHSCCMPSSCDPTLHTCTLGVLPTSPVAKMSSLGCLAMLCTHPTPPSLCTHHPQASQGLLRHQDVILMVHVVLLLLACALLHNTHTCIPPPHMQSAPHPHPHPWPAPSTTHLLQSTQSGPSFHSTTHPNAQRCLHCTPKHTHSTRTPHISHPCIPA